jgi:uncharacterized membrane protein (Fun14 family)
MHAIAHTLVLLSPGLLFVTMQTLAYKGYVQVDHVQVKDDLMNWLDLNQDGKVDADDRDIAIRKVLHVLEFNLPAGSGFVGGLIGGLRS